MSHGTRPPTNSLLEATLRGLAEGVRQIVGAHRCVTSVIRGGDESEALHGVSCSDDSAARQGHPEAAEAADIVAIVGQEHCPLRLTHAELEVHPRWGRLARKGGSAFPVGGLLAAPLVAAEGETIGCIWLSDKDGGDFSAKDEDTLVRLARIASAAIENAQRCQEAEATRREQAEVLGHVLHEIRAFLNPIVLWTNVLSTGGSDKATRTRALEAIERNARKMADFLKTL